MRHVALLFIYTSVNQEDTSTVYISVNPLGACADGGDQLGGERRKRRKGHLSEERHAEPMGASWRRQLLAVLARACLRRAQR